MWAVGVVVYVMLTGQLPFDEEDPNELYEKILKMDYSESIYWDSVSDKAKSFIGKLLTDEAHRLSATQALEHLWIKCPALDEVQK